MHHLLIPYILMVVTAALWNNILSLVASFIVAKLPRVASYIKKLENKKSKTNSRSSDTIRISLLSTAAVGSAITFYLNELSISFSIKTSFLISIAILLIVIFVVDIYYKKIKPDGL